MYYFYHGTQHVFAFKFDEYFVLFADIRLRPPPHTHIYIYIIYDSLYNIRDWGSHDQRWVSFYHCAATTTVGGNRLYNFAHRSSQLLHNGPGSMMRKIPASMDRVAFCVPLFASSNNASYFCVIPPKKDIFPYIRVLLLFLQRALIFNHMCII